MFKTLNLTVLFVLLYTQQILCFGNSVDFQTDVNSFIEAFDDAYSTEQYQPATEIIIGNEVPVEAPVVEEEPVKTNEDPPTPVQEEPVVPETVFPLGGVINHTVNEEVRLYCDKVIRSISPDLRLFTVTEALTEVSDKVRRTLTLVVGLNSCEEESCGVTCRVELVSHSHGDQITSQNCLETNSVMRVKRGAIGGFKQVDDKESADLAMVALKVLDSIDADDKKRQLVAILKAQKQLVNGILYHLTLEVASSHCREDQADCQGPLTISEHNICKILLQRLFSGDAPHNAQVIKSECTPISEAKGIDNMKRSKRDIAHDGNEINSITNVIAPKKKKTHRMVGGPLEQDPHSDNIKEISEFALSQIDKSSNSLNKQKIVRVVDARSQVVAGVKYFLKLELVETNCRKGSNQANCSPVNSKVLQECDVVVWDKPWMKFRAMTSANCQTAHQRDKRALRGKKAADVNSYNIHKIAEFAVEQLDAKSNSLNAQRLVVVKEAQTQTVAGTNYFLKLQLVETQCRKGTASKSKCEPAANSVVQECDVVIYDRPWERHREMTSSDCHTPPTITTRKTREVLVGGRTPADPNDERVQEIAQFAVSSLDARSNSLNKQKLVVVKEAKTQVVAGVNYYLKLQMVETTCRKGAATKNQCNATPGSVVQECDVVVYDRPWDKHREMTSAKCSAAPSANLQRNRRDTKTHRRVTSGGRVDLDKSSAKVREMAQQVVKDVNWQTNSPYEHVLQRIVTAQTQLVNGVKYFLTVVVAETECRKNDDRDNSNNLSECQARADAPTMLCDYTLHERPHENAVNSNFNCSSSRSTHTLLTQTNQLNEERLGAVAGGRVEMDKRSAKVSQLARQAVRDVNRQLNSPYRHALLEVVRAQSQVVSGVKYYLTVVVAQTECHKHGDQDDSSDCQAPANAPTMVCDFVLYELAWESSVSSSFNCSGSRSDLLSTHSKLTQTQISQLHIGESMPGSAVEMDKSSAKVHELAGKAVKLVNMRLNSPYRQSLVRVVSAKSQAVSGVKYYLTVVVAQTECRKHGDLDDSSECQAPANAPTMVCDYMLYERAGDYSMSSSFNCSGSRSGLLSTHSKLTQTTHTDLGEPIPGSPFEVDRNSAKVQELASKAVRDVNMRLNSPYRQTLLQVISAKSQVVNGVKYYLKIALAQTECYKNQHDNDECRPNVNAPTMLCDYVFYQRPSENSNHISHSYNCSDASSGWRPGSHDPLTSPERRDTMPGAPVEMDKRSAKVSQLARQAVRDVNRQLNSPYRHALLEVVQAQSQVVNGVIYYLKAAMAQTQCTNNGQDISDSSECLADADAPTMLCNFMFYEELGQNGISSSSFNCSRPLTMSSQYTASETRTLHHQQQASQESSPEGCSGCITDGDINTETVQADARDIVKNVIDKKLNSPYRHKLMEVLSVKSQVVAGFKTWLKIKIVETSCRKGTNEDIEQCSPNKDSPVKECEVITLVGSDQSKETSFTCSSHTTRSTQSHSQRLRHSYSQGDTMPGAPVEMDKRSTKVSQLAHQAVRDVNRQLNSPYWHALLEVVKAQSQVVSGVKYYLSLVVAQTECRKHGDQDDSTECQAPGNAPTMTCNFVFYERPGQNSMASSSFNCSSPMTMSSRYTASETRTYQQQHKHQTSQEFPSEFFTDEDIHSETVKSKARDLVKNLIDKKSNSPYRHKLLEVVSARRQTGGYTKTWLKIKIVESSCPKGSYDDIDQCSTRDDAPVKECDVESTLKPGGGQESSYSCSAQTTYSTHSDSQCQESHESMPMTGGLSPRDTNEDDIKTMARYALAELDASSNSLNQQKLIQVKKAQSQVVAGTNYYLKLQLVETNCRKGYPQPASECLPDPSSVVQECDVVIYDRPWDNHREMTSADCKDSSQHSEKMSLGRWEHVAVTDPEVREAAKLVLKTIDSHTNQYYKSALVNIVSAKVQVGSGKKYMLVVEVGESTCSKYQAQENCPLKEDSSLRFTCDITVWDRPWLNKKEVVNYECNGRTRRAAVNETEEHLRLFDDFKSRYNKTYKNEVEHKKRFRIFRANLKKIDAFQANEQGTAIYGATMFADLTKKEFKQDYLGLKRGPAPRSSSHHMRLAQIPDVELPTDFDWRDHGAVTPVKNQGMCGSCWAFSVTGNVEGQWFLKHGKLLSLSEQELVDCDKSDSGCNGGYMTVAYEAIEKLGGLETEEEYPYDAHDEACHFNKSLAAAQVAGSVNITTNETQIAQWLVKNGPISIGINANAMQFYMGGVSHPFKFLCNKNQLDHGVLLVGFGVHRTSIRHKLLPYWLVKNSWGPHWGEKGYYRVYRGDGTCGVNLMASSAIVD